MKTKTQILKSIIFFTVLCSFFLISCKKEESETPDTASMRQLAKDEMVVQNATDEILSDLNDYLSGNNPSFSPISSANFSKASFVIIS